MFVHQGDIWNLNVSELYMVSDRSPDFEETWSFLDRRMSDIGMLISAKTTVSECFSQEENLIVTANVSYIYIALYSFEESHVWSMTNYSVSVML